MYRRRVLLGSTAVLTSLAGCSNNNGGSRTETASETAEKSTGAPTDTSTETASSTESDPETVKRYGESVVDDGLEIVVEEPTTVTEFEHDGETYEMPEGRALSFAPVEFRNVDEERTDAAYGDVFTLVHDDSEVEETRTIDHPDSSQRLDIRYLDGIEYCDRWRSHGRSIDPGDALACTAVFQLSEAPEASQSRIVLDLDRLRRDDAGRGFVAWTL